MALAGRAARLTTRSWLPKQPVSWQKVCYKAGSFPVTIGIPSCRKGSEDNALLGGVLLCFSLLYDPENAMEALSQEGADGLAQFEEIFNSVPTMLCGLTIKAQALVQEQ